ncbi:MAG: VCBS repeat-containing protein [Acidobacteria bacterium]|nr:VCBS repeat-containing protein [Acidobacteriota bacterium]
MKFTNYLSIKIFSVCFLVLTLAAGAAAYGKINLDYDGRADLLVFRPSNGTWYGYRTETGSNFAVRWGLATDKPVPADYDGDGITDIAVFRPETSVWYVLKSSNGQMLTAVWGLATDKLVPADYDGDGMADFAVWRYGDNVWYVLTSSSGYNPRYFIVPIPSDIPRATDPVPADYDGDGKTDFAVRFLSAWFIYQSETGIVRRVDLGCDIGMFAPLDFTGDGYADPGCIYMLPDVRYQWKFKASQDNQINAFVWGAGFYNDLPAPDDYDNDGVIDYAVYRNGEWWIYPSNTLHPYVVNFGVGGDLPAQYAGLKPVS